MADASEELGVLHTIPEEIRVLVTPEERALARENRGFGSQLQVACLLLKRRNPPWTRGQLDDTLRVVTNMSFHQGQFHRLKNQLIAKDRHHTLPETIQAPFVEGMVVRFKAEFAGVLGAVQGTVEECCYEGGRWTVRFTKRLRPEGVEKKVRSRIAFRTQEMSNVEVVKE